MTPEELVEARNMFAPGTPKHIAANALLNALEEAGAVAYTSLHMFRSALTKEDSVEDMPLKPGETAVLIIRRSDTEPEKYFFAVRRSITSSFDDRNDFHIGPFQVPVNELMERTDFDAALDKAIDGLKKIKP
jgi:hypothetical protein